MYKRWGSFYFVERESCGRQKWIRLSTNYREALVAYAALVKCPHTLKTFSDVADRFGQEILPSKSQSTQREYTRQLRFLRAAFGAANVVDIRPMDVRGYRDERTRCSGGVTANRELALLSSIMSWAVEWGAIPSNPCQGVKRNSEHARKRLPTAEEFLAFSAFSGSPIAQFMEIARLTGLRRADILRIRMSDMRDGFLTVRTGKTGRQLAIEISPALRAAIKDAKSIRRPISSMYLICKRNGAPYTPDGFSSIWQRKMAAAMSEGVLEQRFTMHDIRAMAASAVSADHAQELLGHSDPKMTSRYRRGPAKVKPIE